MISIYDNEIEVQRVTQAALEAIDSRLLQIQRFSDTDEEHVAELLKVFRPRANAHIADVGCGVGRLAELMSQQRPDLIFTLINKSASQLEMCPEGFRTLIGLAEDLPLKRYAVDNIMATYILGHVDLPKFISECRRVLDSHGRVFIYDLFTTLKETCRFETDLQYTAMTMNDVIQAFEDAGFHYHGGKPAYVVPDDISKLFQRSDTLNNAVSAAMVFGKQ
jgi:ubiquinone/menaquinone biosynthesis C-methylase UbiE